MGAAKATRDAHASQPSGLVIICCVEVLLEVIERNFLAGIDWCPRILHYVEHGCLRI